jgi:hypothetical protein
MNASRAAQHCTGGDVIKLSMGRRLWDLPDNRPLSCINMAPTLTYGLLSGVQEEKILETRNYKGMRMRMSEKFSSLLRVPSVR